MAATRNNYGAHTIAILTALEERGTCTARQVTDATGLEYDTARQYLRRCAFRGLVTVDHVGRVPAYTVSPHGASGWSRRSHRPSRSLKQPWQRQSPALRLCTRFG